MKVIKDCPFCGGIAVFDPPDFLGTCIGLSCSKCNASRGETQYCDHLTYEQRCEPPADPADEVSIYSQNCIDIVKKILIKEWNQRVD